MSDTTAEATNNCAYEEYLPIINAIEGKHGKDTDFIDLRSISGFTDAFIVTTARSEINARTICDAVSEAMDDIGLAHRVEGESSARWKLIDAGHVVVHIFSKEGREFYNLEHLWGDAPSKRFEDEDAC